MYQAKPNRSHQLLYIALISLSFSLLSISYKHFSAQKVNQYASMLDCNFNSDVDIAENSCWEVIAIEEIRLSKLTN